MRTTYKGSVFTIDEDCADLKEAFSFLAQCQELFGTSDECHNCKGKDIRPKYRRHEKYEFYSFVCGNCGWEFKFGQRKDDGGLFPKGWEPPYDGNAQQQPSQNQARKKLEEQAPF